MVVWTTVEKYVRMSGQISMVYIRDRSMMSVVQILQLTEGDFFPGQGLVNVVNCARMGGVL
jgi:hypothetical protein